MLCFYNCTPSPSPSSTGLTSPTRPPGNTCQAEITKVDMNESNVYYSVQGFVNTNPDCYRLLETWADGAIKHYERKALTVHFLDSLPNFKKPSSGLYGGMEVQDRVIMQVIQMIGGDTMVVVSPFGLEKYRPFSIEKIKMGSEMENNPVVKKN